jgi:hypothetical protein
VVVVGAGFVEVLEMLFEVGSGDIDIGAVFADGDGLVVGGEGARIILEDGVDVSKGDGEAGVARRVCDCFVEEIDELLLAVVAEGIEGGTLRDAGIFGECADESDVLIDSAGVVFEAGEGFDEALTERCGLVATVSCR